MNKLQDNNNIKEFRLRLEDGRDVVLGFDSMSEYESKENPYFGATVGRVANRWTIDNNGNGQLSPELLGPVLC